MDQDLVYINDDEPFQVLNPNELFKRNITINLIIF